MRWVIGDIHGMKRPLIALVEAVRKVDRTSKLIFAGDYVNRGLDSKDVVEFLLTLDNAVFLRGNHDDIFDQVLNGDHYADNATRGDRVLAFTWFMKYGIDSTLLSYGLSFEYLTRIAREPSLEHLRRLVDWVPAAHHQFFRKLQPSYEEDDFFVVHGKWDIDTPTTRPSLADRLAAAPHERHRLLWGRFSEQEIQSAKAWGRTGVFGHTPVSTYTTAYRAGSDQPLMVPVIGNQIVLLDTAAALGTDGRLTAFCVDTQKFLQADHFGQMVGRHSAAQAAVDPWDAADEH